ncbi:MAG: hypothetical protein MJ252_24500 [archaeon]|nr:hypothetical protein [archaeon]
MQGNSKDQFLKEQHDLLNLSNKSLFLKARNESNFSFDYELNDIEVVRDINGKETGEICDRRTKGIIFFNILINLI